MSPISVISVGTGFVFSSLSDWNVVGTQYITYCKLKDYYMEPKIRLFGIHKARAHSPVDVSLMRIA